MSSNKSKSNSSASTARKHSGVVYSTFRERLKRLAKKAQQQNNALLSSSASSDSSRRGRANSFGSIDEDNGGPVVNSTRYQRFSTSISNLFADEQLVCGAVSCFGLLLSHRTEYLLNEADEAAGRRLQRKGSNSGDAGQPLVDGEYAKRRRPDLVLPIGLFIAILLSAATYFIFDESVGSSSMTANANDDRTHWSSSGNYNINYSNSSNATNRHSLYIHGIEVTGNLARTCISLAFLFLLGMYGPYIRLRNRHRILQRRVELDFEMYGEDEEQALSGTLAEDHYDGVCTHALCGCYPVDGDGEAKEACCAAANCAATSNNEQSLSFSYALRSSNSIIPAILQSAESLESAPFDEKRQDMDIPKKNILVSVLQELTKKNREYQDLDTVVDLGARNHCCQRSYRCFSSCCCGRVPPVFCWWQCMSICALAQEAREVKLLVPHGANRVDYITNQPFIEYAPPNHSTVYLSKLCIGLWLFFAVTLLILGEMLLLMKSTRFSLENALVLLATFCQSFVILAVVNCLYSKSYLSIDAITKLFSTGFLLGIPTIFCIEMIFLVVVVSTGWISGHILELCKLDIALQFFKDNPHIMSTVNELLNAFLVAATVEEFSKYYFFRMIDHPDLLFMNSQNQNKSRPKRAGGSVLQFGGSVRTNNIFGSPHGRDGGYKDNRTMREKAAAVAIAMVSVATGLACAENIMYVFLRSGSNGNAKDELMMLGIRSIFPVHPLCAAIQSTTVIRKYIELPGTPEASKIGVTSIVLPSILLHGVFDAVLMVSSTYINTSTDSELAAQVSQISWMIALSILPLGAIWYLCDSRCQRDRLKLADIQKQQAELSWENIGVTESSSSEEEGTVLYRPCGCP